MEVSPRPTERMGHATRIAREVAEDGFEMAIAWGGDGTLNEVACGLCDSSTAMGVLPGGTVNVFAREVGISLTLSGALDTLVGGRIVRIPMGFAGERPFLLMAGVGLDGEVVYRLKSGFKAALGAFAFWLDGFRLLASYPMSPVHVRVGGKEIVGTGLHHGKYPPLRTVLLRYPRREARRAHARRRDLHGQEPSRLLALPSRRPRALPSEVLGHRALEDRCSERER